MPEANERKQDAAEENRMEVNYNGHASTPETKASPESQVHGTKQEQEEKEDQENANQPENHTETHDALSNKEEHQTCNGSAEDPENDLQQLPASVSPDSVTVELKEGEREEKKEEEMDTQGENKRGEEEDDSQNG